MRSYCLFPLAPELRTELNMVDERLRDILEGSISLLKEALLCLVEAGGKRLRPALALICGRLGHYDREKVLPIATALELIHMATLVHDDVVDGGLIRRGCPTVKALFGDQISVHAGDYLFARALAQLSAYEDYRVAQILSQVGLKMCLGELDQMKCASKAAVIPYFRRIRWKTALLLEASCVLGALVCDADDGVIKAVRKYGRYIGMAFQIIDDVLDLVSEESTLGKPVRSDLSQGIFTLPVILGLRGYGAAVRPEELNRWSVEEILTAVGESGGTEKAMYVARAYVRKAKEALARLPLVDARRGLEEVADFVLARSY